MWLHIFWNLPQLSYQAVFLHEQKLRIKTDISQEQKELSRWNKEYFSIFLKDLVVARNCSRPKSASLKEGYVKKN